MLILGKKSALDLILRDVKKKQKKALKRTAKRVTAEIQKQFNKTVETFYDDYDPQFYIRTYSTYFLSNNFGGTRNPSSNIKDPTPTEEGYLAGIDVGPEFINGEPYKDKLGKDYITDRTWNQGIHGTEAIKGKGKLKGSNPNEILETKVLKSFGPKTRKIKKIFDEEFAKES